MANTRLTLRQAYGQAQSHSGTKPYQDFIELLDTHIEDLKERLITADAQSFAQVQGGAQELLTMRYALTDSTQRLTEEDEGAPHEDGAYNP